MSERFQLFFRHRRHNAGSANNGNAAKDAKPRVAYTFLRPRCLPGQKSPHRPRAGPIASRTADSNGYMARRTIDGGAPEAAVNRYCRANTFAAASE